MQGLGCRVNKKTPTHFSLMLACYTLPDARVEILALASPPHVRRAEAEARAARRAQGVR